jgi:hypothetical protein
MTFYNSAGTRLTETTLNALVQEVTEATMVRFTADVYQAYTEGEGSGGFEKANRLAFVAGQVVPQSMIDGLFQTATIDTVTPSTGPAAGGTAIVIKGNNFSGTVGVTVGGNAVTNFKVVNDETITGTTAAHAAGATNVVVQDDAGDVTKTGGFTFV